MKSVNTQAVAPAFVVQPQRKPRVGGFLKGQWQCTPDCWEKDEDIIKLMLEGPLFPEGYGPDGKPLEEALQESVR